MKKIILFVSLLAVASANGAGTKDVVVVQSPDGSVNKVSIPKTVIKEVKPVGPNEYDVKIDKGEMKKIEVQPVGK